MLRIGVISRLTLDFLFKGLDRLPEKGEELRCSRFRLSLGGGPVASAVILNRLGLPVRLGTFIDDSHNSEMALRLLKEEGLQDYVNLYRGGWNPITVSSVIPIGSERSIISYEDRCIMPDEDVLLNFFSGCDVALFNYDPSLVRALKLKGKTIVFDTDDYQKTEIERSALQYVDVITPNLREAEAITHLKDARDCLRWFRDSGVAFPLVKMGSSGCICFDGDDIVEIPAVEVDHVCDTTGAGDNFLAGLLYGYSKGWTFMDCVRMANVFGSLSTTALGVFGCPYDEKTVLSVFDRGYGQP